MPLSVHAFGEQFAGGLSVALKVKVPCWPAYVAAGPEPGAGKSELVTETLVGLLVSTANSQAPVRLESYGRTGQPVCLPASDFLTPDQGRALFWSIMITAASAGLGGLATAETAADDVFAGLNAVRSETGAAVAARLELGDQSFVGTNLARANSPLKGTFSFFVQHAEGDAFFQALSS